MAKFKAKKKKTDAVPQMKPGLPCLIIVIGGICLVALIMVMAMRNAG